MTVLIGGVAELYQGDHDLGRLVVEELSRDTPPGTLVEDFYYGAVAVTQRLQEVRPHLLVLVGTQVRGRSPGTVERRRIYPGDPDPGMIQRSVADAVTGYVNLDLVLDVVTGLDALPPRTVVFEVEPAHTTPAENLSPEAQAALEEVLVLVRDEVERAPLFELVGRLEETVHEERLEATSAINVLESLLGELREADRTGSWGTTFSLRDRLRMEISGGGTGEGMTHLDWGLWWGLIEELDRLQSLEASSS